jgi:hypothetical protein
LPLIVRVEVLVEGICWLVLGTEAVLARWELLEATVEVVAEGVSKVVEVTEV